MYAVPMVVTLVSTQGKNHNPKDLVRYELIVLRRLRKPVR